MVHAATLSGLRGAALTALAGCTFAACAVDLPAAEVDARPPAGELELGGATNDGTGFVALADGADVTLIPGAQGGFHVWISVRSRGVAGDLLITHEARRVTDGTLVLAGSRRHLAIPDDAIGAWWSPARATPSFMCPAPLGVRVFDEPLRFRVTLTGEDDQVVSTGQLVVTPRCPTGAHAAFCADICAG